MTTKAVTLYQNISDPIEAIDKMGEWIAKSGMFGCDKVEQGRVIALACLSEQKSPLEIIGTYHIIGGRLHKRADAMLADYRAAGGKVIWLNVGDDGEKAEAKFECDGNALTLQYTIEDAKRAGLVKPKSNWQKDPGSMLRARLVTKACRMLMPHVAIGGDTNGSEDTAEPATAQATGELLQKKVDELHPKDQAVVVEAQKVFEGEVIDVEDADGNSAMTDAVGELIGKIHDEAQDFLRAKGWINDDQGYIDLSLKHKTEIVDRGAKFVKAVKAWAKKQEKASNE
ncbi:MAG: hypothetical protein GY851_00480 [bacterium]|nr:hypothetical protein [bacterium]